MTKTLLCLLLSTISILNCQPIVPKLQPNEDAAGNINVNMPPNNGDIKMESGVNPNPAYDSDEAFDPRVPMNVKQNNGKDARHHKDAHLNDDKINQIRMESGVNPNPAYDSDEAFDPRVPMNIKRKHRRLQNNLLKNNDNVNNAAAEESNQNQIMQEISNIIRDNNNRILKIKNSKENTPMSTYVNSDLFAPHAHARVMMDNLQAPLVRAQNDPNWNENIENVPKINEHIPIANRRRANLRIGNQNDPNWNENIENVPKFNEHIPIANRQSANLKIINQNDPNWNENIENVPKVNEHIPISNVNSKQKKHERIMKKVDLDNVVELKDPNNIDAVLNVLDEEDMNQKQRMSVNQHEPIHEERRNVQRKPEAAGHHHPPHHHHHIHPHGESHRNADMVDHARKGK